MARYEEPLAEEVHSVDLGGGSCYEAAPGGMQEQSMQHLCEHARGSCSPAAGSASPAQQQHPQHLLARRKAASEFVQAATGMFLPYASDAAFRAGLKDGVLLCRIANTVWGGACSINYLEACDVEEGPQGLLHQRSHNVRAFLAAAEHQLAGLPADCRFCVADLEAGGCEERPQVVNCLLHVRAQLAGPGAAEQPLPATPASAPTCGRQQQQLLGSPRSAHSAQQLPQRLSFGGTPHSIGGHAAAAGMPSPGMSPLGLGAGGHHHGTQHLQHQHQRVLAPPQMSSSPLMDGQRHHSHTHGHGLSHSLSASQGGGGGSGSGAGPLSLRSSGSYSGLGGAAAPPAVLAQHRSVQAAAGVTKLMQQCTSMLKERMFPAEGSGGGGGRYGSPAGPDSAMKALGPVLEGVLGHLTEEYEKRLLAKDHENSRLCDRHAKLERECSELKAEVQRLRGELESSGAAVALAAAEEAAAGSSALQQQLDGARAALREREAELSEARAALAAASQAQADAVLQLQLEAHALRGQLEGLSGLQERYRRVVEENRRLYSTVQDLRGNIRVFCRIRPPGATGDLSPTCVDVGEEGDLAIYDPTHGTKRLFKVDRVFDTATQQGAVYEDTQPLIRSVLDGFNVCIFAYGQTGSGKTHTMSGTDTQHPEGRGINYRALDDLFAIRDARAAEASYNFRVQMLEIYNEALRDLLSDDRSGANRLDILATQASGCNVPGATQVEVCSAAEVAALMAAGARQRATSETKMNDRSSRSHQILTVIVDGVHEVTKARSHACLHLIDLAGSERVGKSEASGERLVEAQHINKSLSALGDVMAALASKDRHVPYRNSKLTQLLQDSLQGQAKVMMFMHVSPEANMHSESVSTLKFATRVSEITLGQAKKNVVSGKVFEAHEEVMKQQRSVERQEAALQQLQGALQANRADAQALAFENAQLRQQLEAAAAAAAASAKQATRPQLQLPIQQMLAAQAAAAAAGGGSPAASARGGRQSLDGSYGGGGSPASAGSKIPRAQDRTPPRDQDGGGSAQSARLRPAPEASPLGICSLDLRSVEPTPRATPRTARGAGGMPLRESISSQKHLERLQSARQSGSFRPMSGSAAGAAAAAAAASAGPGGGGVSVRQFVEAVSGGGARLGPSVSSGGGGKAAGGGAQGPLSSSRSKLDASMPLTSRTSGVVKGRATELPPMSSGMSMRQGGVYSRSSSSAGGARSGAQTSRTGSGWK